MDAYEANRLVFSRIQALDPDHAAKIMGLLLLQDRGDKEMIRLAFGPETLLHSLIIKARRELGLFAYSPTGMMPMSPSSPSASKCMNFFSQQQQQQHNERAATAALMLGGDQGCTFTSRSRMEEEDVSNYFSIYGPVQDVRIPYQQKRMFGFVTFVFPETVRLILAKGNPHFVCDARVLVKPYKEKGKVPDKFRKQQGEDFRDQFGVQHLGARLMYNNANTFQESQEMLLRRKPEQQQQEQEQAAELQQVIEMQRSKFMGLSLLDLKSRSPTTISSTTTISTAPSNDRSFEESPTEEKSPSLGSSEGEHGMKAVNLAEKEVSNEDRDFQESSVEHNLPDSPFASPSKTSSFLAGDPFAGLVDESEFVGAGSAHSNGNIANANNLGSSTLLPPSSTLNAPSYKTCFLQIPRFSSGHGAVGL
ncbi:zinc finger CCCH domain-containing protein 53-like [Asparagus officinalis]|uniref:zinc finger CCCH domain-containing protein 53-like n=1 Tax=Asparagus officinalis TaxID=4686 RepID=UPI00098E52AA|nr:zinc finger CCCH domain-containing protein 53-like [Asparagus officinalis]